VVVAAAPQAAASGLGSPVCVGQRGFDRHGAPEASTADPSPGTEAAAKAEEGGDDGNGSSSPLAGGLDGGGWLACAGLKKSELESEGRHGCRQVRRGVPFKTLLFSATAV